jgi:hypothetical protein
MSQESLCVPCWGFVLQEENASLPSVKGKPNARVVCKSVRKSRGLRAPR